MGRASVALASFNSGELSPLLDGRTDIAKYGSGLKKCEGFIPMIQGPNRRRGGLRYLGAVRTQSKRAWLVPFQFSRTQSYQVEFGDFYIRFWADRGQLLATGSPAYDVATTYAKDEYVTSAGITYRSLQSGNTGHTPATSPLFWVAATIYEITSPYSESELNSNGLLSLRFVQSADVIYIAHPDFPPYKLARLNNIHWTMSIADIVGGPFKDQNITATTVYADAETGNVTLTASSAIFSSGLVGSLFYLAQKSIVDVKLWEAGKAVGVGALARSDGKNYKALTAGTTGGDKPVHSEGAVYDGYSGVQWAYQDPGFGIVKITGYTSPTVVTGTVVVISTSQSAGHIPSNAVGAGNASTRWAFGAWSDVEGYPSQVAFFKERLCFMRKQDGWMSVSGDYESFAKEDESAEVTTDMAVTYSLQSKQLNDIQWIEPLNSASVEGLVCGSLGSEFVVKAQSDNQPFGPDNYTAQLVSSIGSIYATPVSVSNALLFVQKSGRRLRDVSFDFVSNGYSSQDQSALAEHIASPQLQQITYQQEPFSTLWARRSDGALVAMTYSREQYPEAPHGGWHRHPLTNGGFVESISVIPSTDGTRDELWCIVRYTINGATVRYVCVMEPELQDTDDIENSFYVDAGLTLYDTQSSTLTLGAGALVAGTTGVSVACSSPDFSVGMVGRYIYYRYSQVVDDETQYFTAKALITGYVDTTHVMVTITAAFPQLTVTDWVLTVTNISGLDHLEGQTVKILADGATHPDRTVSGGAVTLQEPAAHVHIGLALQTRMQTMRLDAGAQDGTSQGKRARVPKATIRLFRTVGMSIGSSFDDMLPVDFRGTSDLMDNALPPFTGDIDVDWPGHWDESPWMCIEQPDPLPICVVALYPQSLVSDKG